MYLFIMLLFHLQGTCDFENLGTIKTTGESTSISLLTINDDIALESYDTVKLIFTPEYEDFMYELEANGEFLRDTAFVHIRDNDGKLSLPIVLKCVCDIKPMCHNSNMYIMLDHLVHYAALDINFEESRFSISESGEMANVTIQFRKTQENFTLTLYSVSLHDGATDGMYSNSALLKSVRTVGETSSDICNSYYTPREDVASFFIV